MSCAINVATKKQVQSTQCPGSDFFRTVCHWAIIHFDVKFGAFSVVVVRPQLGGACYASCKRAWFILSLIRKGPPNKSGIKKSGTAHCTVHSGFVSASCAVTAEAFSLVPFETHRINVSVPKNPVALKMYKVQQVSRRAVTISCMGKRGLTPPQ